MNSNLTFALISQSQNVILNIEKASTPKWMPEVFCSHTVSRLFCWQTGEAFFIYVDCFSYFPAFFTQCPSGRTQGQYHTKRTIRAEAGSASIAQVREALFEGILCSARSAWEQSARVAEAPENRRRSADNEAMCERV